MAKGVEDTAFYRYFRLTALNEVGGEPGPLLARPGRFHRAALERSTATRCSLLASQTHDTKRAGDVRARIGALAGMPERLGRARVRRWRELTGGMDDPNEEYLVWQTLVGAWPIVPRAARAVPREGAARGKAQYELDRARTSSTKRA